MDVNLYNRYSLNDWRVGLADRSIFVREVVFQEQLLQICYNSHEKSKYVLILKNEKHMLCRTVNKYYNEIHPRKIFHL